MTETTELVVPRSIPITFPFAAMCLCPAFFRFEFQSYYLYERLSSI